jgi:hypothetical protein
MEAVFEAKDTNQIRIRWANDHLVVRVNESMVHEFAVPHPLDVQNEFGVNGITQEALLVSNIYSADLGHNHPTTITTNTSGDVWLDWNFTVNLNEGDEYTLLDSPDLTLTLLYRASRPSSVPKQLCQWHVDYARQTQMLDQPHLDFLTPDLLDQLRSRLALQHRLGPSQTDPLVHFSRT